MSAQHTPGPWFVGDTIFDNYGAPELVIGHATPHGDLAVAVAISGLKAQTANAHLIAAAPMMLEALRAVISVADRKTAEFDLARQAIAKATGSAA